MGSRRHVPAATGDTREPVRTQRWYYYRGPVADIDDWSRRCCLFAGSSHPELAREVAEYLGVPLADANLARYADTEVSVEVLETVRGRDVFVLQSVSRSYPALSVNDALVELMLFVSALRRASAQSITAVLPYYGYARQDRRMGRVPISASDVARVLTEVGVDRIVALDLHSGQIQGFFPPRVPVDNLSAVFVAACYFAELGLHGAVVVSPDAGGVSRAKEFRATLETVGLHLRAARHEADVAAEQELAVSKLAMLIKQRSGPSQIERMDLIGSVADQDVILVDDILDTAGTLCTAAAECKRHGARRVFAFCTHGLFSGAAPLRVAKACAAGHLEFLVVANTVPQLSWPQWKLACGGSPLPDVRVLTVAALLAEVIKRIVQNERLNVTNMVAHVAEAASKL